MGVIQKQSIQSTIIIMFGFAIGAFNMIIFAPKVLTSEEIGLTRIITDAGLTLATMCTLGTIPVINKFFPFYKRYLEPEKNDLPFITLAVCFIGYAIMCVAGYLAKDIVVRKFSDRSPLFVEYSYLVYPFGFFMLLFIWLESFSWALHKSVVSNSLKEALNRFIFTILLLLFLFGAINLNNFFILFSLSYAVPVILLFVFLRNTGNFKFTSTVSPVTMRMKGKMVNLGFFIFGAQFLNLLSRTIDTFILSAKSTRGLSDAAVFTIATYIVTLLEVPQRSITSSSVPVLAESWRNKDLKNISNIYSKSVCNLLVIGLAMFGLIWLNIHNLAAYLGADFKGITEITLLMGIGKLIDLGTGTNSQIIGTSSYWRVDFTTNVVYTLLAIPLNYFLIDRFGLLGAAYSFLIGLTFYNTMRFGFLWFKFRLQPYTLKDLFAILIGVVATAIVYLLPANNYILLDGVIRSVVFLILFVPAIYFAKISDEINALILQVLQRTGLFRKR